MHYECRNLNHLNQKKPCPKFGKLVQRRTVAKKGLYCEECSVEMRPISPPSKRGLSKHVRRINTSSGSGKPTARKKSGTGKKGTRKWVSSKHF
jgi:hypothetical protein